MSAREPGADEPAQHGAPARLVAFATALKQSAIYPPGHPRVRHGVAEALAPIAARGGGTVLLRDGTFHVDGVAVAADQVALRWLAERLRELELRGLEITAQCTPDDVLAFAAVVRDARRTDPAAAWPVDHPRLRALPLVFAGRHVDGAADLAAAAAAAGTQGDETGAAPFATLPPAVGAVLAAIGASDEYRAHVAAIERGAIAAGATSPTTRRDVELLETIGNLIPAEVAADPERINGLVQQILHDFAAEVRGLATRDGAGASPRLLRRAVDVARRFFPVSAPAQVTQQRASGRPEDARIVADLGALLRELDALPAERRDVSRLVADAMHSAVDHELLGIHLYVFTNGPEPAANAVARLTELLRDHASERTDLLDCYLAPRERDGGAPSLRRCRLLGLLVDAGHLQLVRERRYVDQRLLAHNFPAALPLAARVLGTEPSGAAVLRAALAAWSRTLAAGGAEAAIASGVLRDPAVLRALLAAGGDEARMLVAAAANANARGTRAVLLEHLRARALPELAALVLRVHPSDDALPSRYVRSLWLACEQNRADPEVDAAGAELLVHALAAHTPVAHRDRVAAMSFLCLAPRDAAEALLRRLASAGRFTRWGRAARELRREAARALVQLGAARSR